MAEGSSKKKPTRRVDLERALEDRLRDADALLAAGRYASTIAMGLYALEISLKVAICVRLDLDELPELLKTHDAEILLVYSGLKQRIRQAADGRILQNWALVTANNLQQVNDLRYLPDNQNEGEARAVLELLRSSRDGVITWIRTQL